MRPPKRKPWPTKAKEKDQQKLSEILDEIDSGKRLRISRSKTKKIRSLVRRLTPLSSESKKAIVNNLKERGFTV